MGSAYGLLLRNVVEKVLTRVEITGPEEAEFRIGLRVAYHDVLMLIRDEAEVHGLNVADVGLDGVDLVQVLSGRIKSHDHVGDSGVR